MQAGFVAAIELKSRKGVAYCDMGTDPSAFDSVEGCLN